MDIDRRTLLKMLALALAALGQPALAATGTTAGNAASSFGAAVAALTGYPVASPGDVAKMLAGFATPERRAALARLERIVAATPAAGLDEALRANRLEALAKDLVAAWYSGIVTHGKVQELVLYIDAYVWSAMSFTKPMGMCGGVTGYWSDPPK